VTKEGGQGSRLAQRSAVSSTGSGKPLHQILDLVLPAERAAQNAVDQARKGDPTARAARGDPHPGSRHQARVIER